MLCIYDEKTFLGLFPNLHLSGFGELISVHYLSINALFFASHFHQQREHKGGVGGKLGVGFMSIRVDN